MIITEEQLEYKVRVGANIKRIRERKGISQEKLCDRLKMKIGTLINLEKGRHAPLLTTLKVIADALETPVKDFV